MVQALAVAVMAVPEGVPVFVGLESNVQLNAACAGKDIASKAALAEKVINLVFMFFMSCSKIQNIVVCNKKAISVPFYFIVYYQLVNAPV